MVTAYRMKGIFCIETRWDTDGCVSVKENLSSVAAYHGARRPELRPARTPHEFEKCLNAWSQRTDWEFPILYLAFHGFEDGVEVRSSGEVSLWDNVRLAQIADFSEGKPPPPVYGSHKRSDGFNLFCPSSQVFPPLLAIQLCRGRTYPQ